MSALTPITGRVQGMSRGPGRSFLGQRPHFIALCGYPGSGKTTVADFLVERFGARLVDDGRVLREAAMALYGLAWEDVYTQEGKAKRIEVCGKLYTHRQLCGHLGNLLEGFYGEQFVPEQTYRQLDAEAQPLPPLCVFPSVRKTQGITHHARGGMIIEVIRAGCAPENDFDHYDTGLVDHTIVNGGSLDDLRRQVAHVFQNLLGYPPRQEKPV